MPGEVGERRGGGKLPTPGLVPASSVGKAEGADAEDTSQPSSGGSSRSERGAGRSERGAGGGVRRVSGKATAAGARSDSMTVGVPCGGVEVRPPLPTGMTGRASPGSVRLRTGPGDDSPTVTVREGRTEPGAGV